MIILPDIHGRTFWKDAVKGHEDDEIIFLGDYLDPYQDEFPDMEPLDIRKNAISNFKEIIEFKKNHMGNVILLIGNHDAEYMVSIDVCNCRRDNLHYKEIQNLFRENKDLFQLCYQKGDVLFSHGGIRQAWMIAYYKDATEENMCDILNNAFANMMKMEFPDEDSMNYSLACCSFYRGGCDDYSSPVWGDVREWIYGVSRPYKFYQIFGHTRIMRPFVTKDFACLDCSRGFILTDENKITELDGTEIPITDLNDNNE